MLHKELSLDLQMLRLALMTPFPLQTGHAPKELKLNKPAGCPVSFENMERISSIIPIYVASVERLEIPILPCPTMMVSG